MIINDKGIDLNLLVPESKKTEKWIEGYINYCRNLESIPTSERIIDVKCWKMYNNQMDLRRFDYFLKVGNNSLPAYPRHVPLQRTLVDILVSQQLYRPFTFSVQLDDKDSVYEKWVTIIKAYLSDMKKIIKQRFYQNNAMLQKIDMQAEELRSFVQRQPQSEEEMQQQMQLRAMLPDILARIELSKSELLDEQAVNDKQLKELDHYYRFSYKDFKEHLAQKVLIKLRNELKIKEVSKSNFLNQCVTGKQYYYVDLLDGEKYPRFESLLPSKVSFPKISNIKRVEDGPWVKVTEYLSFQQVAVEFGGEIVKKYGEEKLKELSQTFYSTGASQYASTPYGDLEITNYDGINYSGVENENGLKVERVFFKCPRKLSIKYSPNPYQEGEFFRHFIDKYKIPLNADNFMYMNGKYVDKNNDQITFNKSEVEKYSESKGEFVKDKYLNDIYEGVVINDEIFVKCRKKSVIRHPDKKSKVKHPVIGPSFSDMGEQPYSIIWATKDLQELYDFIHTQRELMLALAGTKTIFYDRGQKPGDLGDDEFFEQLKKGIAYVETIDKATGQPKRSNFNQWSMVDLSVSSSIQYLDNMLGGIEETMGNIVGIPRARKGQVVNTDQVGTFQESINRAQLITEVLYYEHDQIEADALNQLLNLTLKYSFRDGDEFEVDDANFGKELVSIPPELFRDSYVSVVVYNHSEEKRKMEELREIMSIGLKRGEIGMEALLEAWGTDTVVALKKKIEYFVEKARELSRNNALEALEKEKEVEVEKIKVTKEYEKVFKEMELAFKQQELQLNATKAQLDNAIKQRDLQLKEKGIDLDAQFKNIELQNERESEMGVLMQNEKHMTANEQLKAIQLQLDYILKTLGLSEQVRTQGLQHVEGMRKIGVDDKKVDKTVKEHVSDK